jgi:ribonuclease P protein component
MLPRQERLTRSSEFAYVYRRKKSVANSLLILYVGRKKQDISVPTRAGFVVGKKVHKSAVKRNKIKRRLREAYRELSRREDFRLKESENLIFIARPAIIESDYHEIFSAVKNCVKKADKKFNFRQ